MIMARRYNAATESANNEFEGVSILLNAAPVNTTAVPEIFITQNTVPILDEEVRNNYACAKLETASQALPSYPWGERNA